jgi:quinol monooxygenase YgiN
MSKIALFVRLKALPGKRDEVRRVWEKHLKPNIAENPASEAYFYCYDEDDPDTICAFQQYADRDGPQAFAKAPWYAAYIEEVSPLLAERPEIRTATALWAKGTTI